MNGYTWKYVDEFSNYSVHESGYLVSKISGKVMNGTVAKNGYKVINLIRDDGKKIVKLMHRMVAEAFLPNEDNKRTVNHIDGNKINNNVSNLEWATDGENGKHSYDKLNRVAYMTGRFNELNHNSEDVYQYSIDGLLIKKFNSQREASRQTGICYKTINRCVTGKSHTSGGFVWRKNEE
jgi:hypothetical protein